MTNLRRGGIIALSTILCLSITSLAIAQTPERKIRHSPILPYLLDNPNDSSTVRVRCLPRERHQADSQRRMIRDSLLQPNLGDRLWRGAAHREQHRQNTVTIEIEGSCRNVRVHLQDDSDSSEFDDDWLNREGSGWYWLRNRR
jgi:hypothetical protein